MEFKKVKGENNPADLMTKNLSAEAHNENGRTVEERQSKGRTEITRRGDRRPKD